MYVENSGVLLTPRSQQDVFEMLADPNQFAPLLPDLQSMELKDSTHFDAQILGTMGSLSGPVQLQFELLEATRVERVRYLGQGLVARHRINFNTGFELSDAGSGTIIDWHGNFSVEGGMVFLMGSTFRTLGETNIKRLISNLQEKLEAVVRQA